MKSEIGHQNKLLDSANDKAMEIAATLPMDDQESLEARFEEIDLENVESQLNKLSSKLTNSLKNFNTLKQGATENAKRSKELVDYKLEFPISMEDAKYQLETVQVSAHLDASFWCRPLKVLRNFEFGCRFSGKIESMS